MPTAGKNDRWQDTMTPEERKAAIESLKEICREIGCSGLSPDMCNNRPHHCSIIRKLVVPANTRLHSDGGQVGDQNEQAALPQNG